VANMVTSHMWSEGDLVQTELDRTVEGLRLIGEVSGTVDWPHILDRSFLPADLQK
jgi:NitT/TauT family transport system substrate-binding protein